MKYVLILLASQEMIKKPWLQMYLRDLHHTSSRVMAGEIIDPYLDWVRTVSDVRRVPDQGGQVAWRVSYLVGLLPTL